MRQGVAGIIRTDGHVFHVELWTADFELLAMATRDTLAEAKDFLASYGIEEWRLVVDDGESVPERSGENSDT